MENSANPFDLAGKRVLVTGALGILGSRLVRGFASCGADVACLDLDAAALQERSKELAADFGVRCEPVYCDLKDPKSFDATVASLEATFGPLDVLINNAASKSDSVEKFLLPLEDYDPETWRQVVAVNLEGAFFMARSVGQRMALRRSGSIVQVASIYGLLGPDQRIYDGSEYLGRRINTPPVYTASKAGVIGLTKHLATYWGDRGVRVNTVTPGGIESGQNQTFKERYSARIPLGRMANVEELVWPTVFLASPAASYITGHNLVVDGGLSAW